MKHWQSYVKAGWELVVEAQGASQITLHPDVECFLVHTIARTFEKTDLWDQPIASKLLTAQGLFGSHKQGVMRTIGEECLFIDSWELKQRKWPTTDYFANLGSIAFGIASNIGRPPDELLGLASTNFNTMSKVLKNVKTLYQNRH